jgi:hypothetical protein
MPKASGWPGWSSAPPPGISPPKSGRLQPRQIRLHHFLK